MPKPKKWERLLQTCRAECRLALKLYADSTEPRSFESFIVHAHLAWLMFFHAHFEHQSIDYRYWENNRNRLQRRNGQILYWDLAKCVNEYWRLTPQSPVRKNLEYFIALRNHIEHRGTSLGHSEALLVSDRAQAMIRNLELELLDQFDPTQSLSSSLRFPILVGSLSIEGERTLDQLYDSLPQDLRQFSAQFENSLSDATILDQRYRFRLGVVLTSVRRGQDGRAVKFIDWDSLSNEDRTSLREAINPGFVVERDRHVPVANLQLHRPTSVTGQVKERIPFEFNMNHHSKAWSKNTIRPPLNDPLPTRTESRYCVYDLANATYLYTDAWIEKLVRECSTEEGFRSFIGIEPKIRCQ